MTKEKKVSEKQLANMIREMVRKELKNRKKINENKKSPAIQKISLKQLREMIRESLKEAKIRKKKQ